MNAYFPRLSATTAAALLSVVIAGAMPGGVATAQEAAGEGGTATGAAEDGGQSGTEPGSAYFGETFADWKFRCVRAPEGQRDPCQLYQLLEDQAGNSVAEMTVIPLPEQQDAEAGVTIITPLGTLLTTGLQLSVDGGEAGRYPFRLCNQAGCVVQFGLSPAELAAFKRGVTAAITIVPAQAPDQTVGLNASLSGFTAGYEALLARRSEN